MKHTRTFRAIFYLTIALFVFLSVDAQSSDGYWEMVGYGRVISMKGDKIKVYDVNEMSCVNQVKIRLHEIGEISDVTENTLTIQSGINVYTFNRIDALPELCGQNKSKKNDPLYNFDSMWYTFKENYCYFEERDIDWDAYYKKYRSQLNAQTDDVELYKVMDEMLKSIGDDHIGFEGPKKVVKAYREKYPPAGDAARRGKFLKILNLSEKIADQYCEDHRVYNNGLVRWGMLQDDVAYVQINAMMAMADYGIPQSDEFVDFWKSYLKTAAKKERQDLDEIAGAKKVIEKILAELDAEHYVVDLRFNPGGKDEVALEFINHLTDSRSKTFSKKTRLGDGYTEETDFYFEPAESNFTGDVYLLLSYETSSAAEIFSMSSLAAPNFTRIGGRTNGIFSDVLEKQLTPDGSNYENKGIGVDYDLDYPADGWAFYDLILEQLPDGDSAIAKALELIAVKKIKK